ncbi:DUF4382 domain-containing protein [bacterium]|nr:DUF4382 domain-containing protein [bacterium]
MRLITLFLIGTLSLAFVLGCGDDNDKSTSPGETTGTLKLLLTDSPGIFQEVNITFSEISANYENEWITVSTTPQTFDLLKLSSGITALLGEKKLEAGHYSQIRLIITGAEVIISDNSYPLAVPSGASSGLKLGPAFDIEPGIDTELVVDFDVARSIHEKGKKQEYTLNPRLRLIPKAQSGAIKGRVTNYQASPVAYAIAGSDTVNSAFVSETNGDFLLSFMPAGSFTVAVADTLGNGFSTPDVAVTIGKTTELGEITLK